MFIQTEVTPNPSTLKFLPGQEVLQGSIAEFKSLDESANSPLAQRLFGLAGVARVMLGDDFVSVSKDDVTDWSMLKPMVLTALMEHFATGQPVLLAVQEDLEEPSEDDDEISAQIKILIAERVRPAVQQDGGDIVFDRFDQRTGQVFLKMRGACSGCPSSTMTLKSGIENMLRHYIPEVTEVLAVPD